MADKKIYMKPANKFSLVGNHVVCETEKPGKISGTSLGAILGEHAYKSEFSAAVDLFGLADEDMTFNKYVRAGKLLEEPIVKYIDHVYGSTVGQFIPASKIFPENVGAHNDWTPHFEHPIFTGHIDGALVTDDGEQFVLEVKTTHNIRDWFRPVYENGVQVMNEDGTPKWHRGGVPDHYYWQVALYNEFVPDMQKDCAYFLVGILEDSDYEHPEQWTPNVYGENPNVKLLKVPIDRAEVQRRIAEAEEWYQKYILNGITPDYDYDNNKDYALWNHLLTVSSPKGVIQSMADRADYLKKFLAPLIREKEQLEENIEKWMKDHMEGQMESEYGLNVTLTLHERTAFDKKLLIEAYGITDADSPAYKKTTTYHTLTIEDPNAPKKKKGKKEKSE